MDNMVLQKVWQQGQRLTVDDLSGCAFTGEDAAHTFEISGKNASGAVAISGTIAGKFLRSDNVTVPVTGTASDGVASITLTEDCYAVPGRFIFSVYANDGTHNICIYCGVGTVLRTDSGEYEGGEIITDVTALINAIETAVATIPADYSTLLAAIAPTFSASTAYAAGSYVWYDGNLYKFTADHAAGSWTGTDAVAVALGTDLGNSVAELKSAVTVNDQKQIYGLQYNGLTIPNNQTYVSEGQGNVAVYPIEKFDAITVDITYSADKFINRDGLAFSDNPIPTPNETIYRINTTSAVSEDKTITFINPGYKYFYIYYSNAITQAGDPNQYLKVSAEKAIEVPDGYEEVFPTWRQGGFTETTASNRILSSYIDVDPIGRNWLIIVPAGYLVNVGAYSVYKTGDTDSPNEHVYSSLQSGIVEPSKTNNFFRGKFRILGAKVGNANLNNKADAVIRVFRQKTDSQYMASRYSGKKVSIMGDSISTYGSIDDAGTTGDKYSPAGNPYTYPGNLVRYPQTNLAVVEPEQTYWLKTIKNLGMTLGINESIAGSTVAWDGETDNDKNYGANYCMSSNTRIGHLDDNGTPDIIIVNGGTNDPGFAPDVPIGEIDYTNPTTYTDQQIAGWSDSTSEYFRVNTFCGAYQTMLIRMMKAYPLAKIICLLPNFAKYTVRNLDNYCEAIKEICDLYGIKWIDMRTSGIRPFNQSSYMNNEGTSQNPAYIHPNYNGMQLLGDRLTKALLYEV